ncbi:GIY-YIG nuclease family protein [Arthrobacter sp. B2a2-09]|uniref:GIY-YIG nuclease family protein n=1 Tax=Arthrobacter sp. B2a2-09 TaxID=2952822 RepID=UPI0022CDB8C7|nr:GIY-YIG nuclease family protein [Arthrobacter sp. B2a2-09]MCZ9884740.1 GIY-YIG nuclease family protein [Arthrobacter sp. B2a2-09]
MTHLSPGWHSYPLPNTENIVRWWDGEHWSDVYGSVLRADGSEPVSVIGQIRDLKVENIQQRFQLEWKIRELEGEVSRLQAERAKPATDVEERVAAAETELERINGRVDSARRLLEVARNEAEHELELNQSSHPGFPEYTTIADSSDEAMAKVKDLRNAARGLIRSGSAYTLTPKTFMSEEGIEVSFPDWMKLQVANELVAVFNRQVEIEASRKSGEYDYGAVLKTWYVLRPLAYGLGIDLSEEFFRQRADEILALSAHRFRRAEEREEARYARAEAREEARVQAELEREKAKLERDLEHHFNAMVALEKKGDQDGIDRMWAAIAVLEKKIADVDLRALNIRTGYVYVISNLGAFGPEVVKIGLTRRLDPLDRISELSSASVPYRFDVHALFFSEDAVGIEKMLHHHFDDRRVNRVNKRKEFFRATPSEVLNVLREHKVELVDWTDEPYAFEYRLGLQQVKSDSP